MNRQNLFVIFLAAISFTKKMKAEGDDRNPLKNLLSVSFGFSPGTEGVSGDGERRHGWQAETLRFPVVLFFFP